DTQDPPSTPPETTIQPVISQTTTSEPTSALFQLTQETLSQTHLTETQTLSQNSVLPSTEISAVNSTVPLQTETSSGYYGGGGAGGGSPPAPTAPVPQVDVTSPIISIIGDNPATSSINSEYVDAGATAVDDIDGVVSVTSTSTVDTANIGSYFVTYTAADVSGNIATTTRAVNIVDTSAPEITINGTNPTTIEINSTYSDLGATASDAIDGARSVATTSNVDTSRIGTYSVIYVAFDLSQNTSTSTRTVNVVDIIETTPALFSDLNTNGIADADESDVIAISTMSLTAGEYHFNNLTITNNATLALSGDANSSSTFKGVKIVATNITIDAGSRISADAKGDTPGAGFPSSIYAGGSHGGVGLNNTATSTYGSAKQPTTLGSAGGAPHAIGGGSIRLVISGTLVNNGVISADGNTSSSGGSIYATVADISGSGTFHANGGALGVGGYFSGPGGGGRVAVYYQTSTFSGTAEALGGCGSYDGWSQTCAEKGTAGLFDTTNNNFSSGSSWRFQVNDGASNFNRVTLSNGAVVTMDENATINANELQSNGASLTLSNGSSITVSTFIASGGTITFSGGETLVVNTLTLSNNAIITVAQERVLSLSATNLTIGVGSSISVNYKGYGQSAGPGAGFSNAGASHGGVGLWNTASSTYGSMREPTEMGSGGNGYNPRGGGAIRIVVSESLVNNGSIVAIGNNTSSGGSIYVTTNSLSGTGEFRADGGTVYCPNSCVGAGAGGRIAVYYQTSIFGGMALASGPSTSYGKAGDGTVVVEEIATTPPPSSARAINTFEFLIGTSTVSGIVDETAHTVSITVPFGTDVSALSPLVAVSSLATSSPASAVVQDFTNPVIYTVTAEDGSTQTYTVTVIIAPDTVAPTITTYTFNETSGDITIDLATTTLVSFALTASENVDWVSIKIEDQNTPDNYKIFFSSVGCVDGTDTCAKSWDGTLSSGGMAAPNGTYRIKTHIRDMAGNIYQDYLSPYVITVNTVLP
ncbi:MAG: immunoglobulin-like domain-containing protein, partial [Minisyncoccia bacterium]